MTVHRISPEGLLQPVPYAHVAIGTGSRQVHVAGQTARRADGGPIESDNLADQIADALRNVGTGLAGAGATFADVVRLTFYIPDWDASKIDDFTSGVTRVSDELGIPQPSPPVTMIGVAHLWEPDILVEIEAYATLD